MSFESNSRASRVKLAKRPSDPEAVAQTLGRPGSPSNLSSGRLVADVADGRTSMDLARFELEAESLLGAPVALVSSDATMAGSLPGLPLRVTSPA